MTGATCTECSNIEDLANPDSIYIVWTCPSCGRKVKRSPERGRHGIGINLNKGEELVFPKGYFQLHLDPRLGNMFFTRHGLNWLAWMQFVGDISEHGSNFGQKLNELIDDYHRLLIESSFGESLKGSPPENWDHIRDELMKRTESTEYWTFHACAAAVKASDAIASGQAGLAAWHMACSERARAMLVFKSQFEDVSWMGHVASYRILSFMKLWNTERDNSSEEFWHTQIENNTFAISQLFSAPIIFLMSKAYVGGKGIDQQDERVLDFLFSGGRGNQAVLLEIKTPSTQLIGQKYRKNVYSPSSRLSGAVSQIADYRNTLVRHFDSVIKASSKTYDVSAFNPRCVVLIGDYGTLDTEIKRQSFELFRRNLIHIDVITYDELFAKMQQLASLLELLPEVPGP